MTKPNILFLIIDSLRADKFHGERKTSVTPNIDSLIKNGTYFQQAVSPADGTILGWAGIFTSKYPFKTGVRSERFNKLKPSITTYFHILKNENYNFYSFSPKVASVIGLFPEFKNSDWPQRDPSALPPGFAGKRRCSPRL